MSKWTPEDIDKLTTMWFEGLSPIEMAHHMGRTIASCQGMSYRIACKMLGESPKRTAGLRNYL